MMNASYIDIIENYLQEKNIDFNKVNENQIFMQLLIQDEEFAVSILFRDDLDLIHFSCELGMKINDKKIPAILDAIAKANEGIWVGHFDFLALDKMIVFSLSVPFLTMILFDKNLFEDILNVIEGECLRFKNYFFIVSDDKTGFNDACVQSFFLEMAGEA